MDALPTGWGSSYLPDNHGVFVAIATGPQKRWFMATGDDVDSAKAALAAKVHTYLAKRMS